MYTPTEEEKKIWSDLEHDMGGRLYPAALTVPETACLRNDGKAWTPASRAAAEAIAEQYKYRVILSAPELAAACKGLSAQRTAIVRYSLGFEHSRRFDGVTFYERYVGNHPVAFRSVPVTLARELPRPVTFEEATNVA